MSINDFFRRAVDQLPTRDDDRPDGHVFVTHQGKVFHTFYECGGRQGRWVPMATAKARGRTRLCRVCAGRVPLAARAVVASVAFVIGGALAQPAQAHDGQHPVACQDVRIPQGADCHEPGSDLNRDEHPLCIVTIPGDGSAAGSFKFVECLPETGPQVPVAPALIAAGLSAAAGIAVIKGAQQ